MNEIHSIGGQLIIDRSDRDPARQQDPYAQRRRKRQQGGHPERHAAPTAPDAASAGPDEHDAEPSSIGSRLNVRV